MRALTRKHSQVFEWSRFPPYLRLSLSTKHARDLDSLREVEQRPAKSVARASCWARARVGRANRALRRATQMHQDPLPAKHRSSSSPSAPQESRVAKGAHVRVQVLK